jgi:hypothetical protein
MTGIARPSCAVGKRKSPSPLGCGALNFGFGARSWPTMVVARKMSRRNQKKATALDFLASRVLS